MRAPKKKNPPNHFYTRVSSLPEFQSCQRRWAARYVQEVEAEYELRPQGIGSIIGDRCHEGAAKMRHQKHEWGGCEQEAIIDEQVGKLYDIQKTSKIAWDKVTRTIEVGERQIRALLETYSLQRLPEANPKFIEMAMKAKWSDFLILTGTSDDIELWQEGWAIFDDKFGSHLSFYNSQFGGYHILLEAQPDLVTEEYPIFRVAQNWFQRVGVDRHGRLKAQPDMLSFDYNIDACYNAAEHQLDEIERTVTNFYQTHNPWSFNANNRDILCTKKTCRAWGTTWCDQWIKLEDDDDQEDE